MRLVIGTKHSSSWSLRPWLVLKAFGIEFEEDKVLLDRPETRAEIAKRSPSGKVPCLIDGDEVVWDSLAIIEHVAERHPDSAIWPREPAARSRARAVSAEMHSGFAELRALWPMAFAAQKLAGPRSPELESDLARIEEIWAETRKSYGAGGDYLFGAFSAADAMFAPVAYRFRTYGHAPAKRDAKAYLATLLAHPAMAEWGEAAQAELDAATA